MTEGRARVVKPVALGAAIFLLCAPFLDSRVRANVRARYVALGLDSKDPMLRAEARKKLLEIGRPAIDSVYPELIAGEVEEETTGESVTVIVGRRLVGLTTSTWWVEATLSGAAPDVKLETFDTGKIVCPTAQLLHQEDAHRDLLVFESYRFHFDGTLRLAVPLDDDLAPAIIAAVKARLAARKP